MPGELPVHFFKDGMPYRANLSDFIPRLIDLLDGGSNGVSQIPRFPVKINHDFPTNDARRGIFATGGENPVG